MRKLFVLMLVLMFTALIAFGNISETSFNHVDGYGIQMDANDASAVACACPEVSNILYTNLSDGELVLSGMYLAEYVSVVNDSGGLVVSYVEIYNLPLPFY